MPLSRIVVDRPFKDALLAVAVTSLLFAFAFALTLHLEGNGHISHLLLGGVIGFVVAAVGYAAASRSRPMPQPDPRQRFVRLVATAGAGVGLGLLNLGANRAMALLDPRIYALLVERFGEMSPWGSALASRSSGAQRWPARCRLP